MEDVGAQVASPVVIHQTLPQRFHNTHQIAKKRSVPFYSSSFVYQNPSDNWDPKSWDWDSSRFIARPLQCKEAHNRASNPAEDQTRKDDGNLQLKLGGGEKQDASNGIRGHMDLTEESNPVSRPSKRVRSGSPGNANRPMCQVDDCKDDLSTAKDYHRRHKVCEVHSKASNALVGKQMRRFCQQCSRFHPLSEFDDGKRSCRRRLAGHNRRRRKSQPEDATPQVSLPSGVHNDINCDMDVINLLAALARPRDGNREDKNAKSSSLPHKDQLVQILSRINSLPLPAILAAKLPHLKTTSGSASNHGHSENQDQMSANASSQSTMDLLAGLKGTLGLHSDAREIQWQASSERSESEKSKSPSVEDAARLDLQKGSVGGEGSSTSCQHSPMEEVECHAPETSPSLHLQLFSSSPEDISTRKLPLNANYLSSNSSNISREISPTSSPPLVHDLFPMRSSREEVKNNHTSNSEDELACVKSTTSNGCSTSLRLFGGSVQPVEHGSIQISQCQAGYTSSSGSDHSPSSLNSDCQDRTGRIIFKLFDKDPSHLPDSLRSQIFNWLSNSPSEMESYIRPGCIFMSIYLSMPLYAWDRLEENLFDCVRSLGEGIDANFWGNGRFLVCTERQMASHRDGKIHLCKSLSGLTIPELLSVSPVAVVAGQETSLLLRGRSLTAPGTKIHCTHADGYDIKVVRASASGDPVLDEINLSSFKIRGTASDVPGRCFIEVENSIRGTTFPVIIADKAICNELRLLEPQINDIAEVSSDIPNDHLQSTGRPWSRKAIVQFLDELGWLFQRKRNSMLFAAPNYRLNRLKFLLIFAIEHDFCALVKTLLDILLELNLGQKGLEAESMGMLWEIHPLNRAVRRRCQRMVDLLVHYSIIDLNDGSERHIFPPNLAGPGGLTPLHLAACASSLDDMVSALISDPQEVGLHSWNSALDANGFSPYAYATMRQNHSYNSLVARKLGERKNGEVCVSIENENNTLEVDDEKKKKKKTTTKSCSMCAVAAYKHGKSFPSSQGLLQRPYIHSMLLVAAVCVCVCVFLRGRPYVGCVAPFVWENLNYGAS